MKTDDRDERLGTILNDAVRDIDVSSREAPVAQIRVVGRAGRVVAAVAAAAVFLGAGAFAAAQFGRDTPPGTDGSDSVIEGSLATDDWQLERPSDWFTAPFDGCGTAFARGLIVSNVGFEFLNPGPDPVVQRADRLRRLPERRGCDRPRTARDHPCSVARRAARYTLPGASRPTGADLRYPGWTRPLHGRSRDRR
jgi:hypothetical protein